MSGEWWDTPRPKTDVGWNMPYFTTAKYGWETREPISKMLTDIVDNTSEDPNLIADIHKMASEIMYPTDQTTGKDSRYLSTMKEYLCNAFWYLDLDRSHTEYVGPGAEPYDWDESCEDEIIAIWNSIDPTVMRDNIYSAFMKLAYGGWINYDKAINGAVVPKDILSVNINRVTVHGTENGCGSLSTGKNYLKQKTTPIPNGAVGTIETDSGWYTAHQGITFTTGDNIIKGSLTIRHSDNSDISASSQIGDIMLVEGSTIPSVYDADTNLYSGAIKQGYYMDEEYGVRVRELGYSQSMTTTVTLSIRCCSDYFSLKPNTTYSARLFNSVYNDIQFDIINYSASGTVTPTFKNVGGKSIPENGTFVTDTEQWVELTYSHRRTKEYERPLPFDMRPIEYEYCESFADLKAGTYKLMIDIWGNNEWYDRQFTGYMIGFEGYTGCTADNWDWDGTNLTEWFTLLSEDNTAIIPKTDIFEAGTVKYKAQSAGAPFPNYYHREFIFTLSEDTKVGLFHRAYYVSTVSNDYPPYFRFMIVDSDVEAEAFETTGVYPKDMAGYSAWEPYQQVVTVTVNFTNKFTGESESVTTTLQDMLYSNDSFYINTDLEYDRGVVTVDVLERDSVDPTIVPTIDISYH